MKAPPSDSASAAGPDADPDTLRAGARRLLVLTTVTFFVLASWAFFGRLEVVSRATGEVVPGTQVKIVQHLEGGIVAEIHTVEGATVRSGEPLVTLDDTQVRAEADALRLRQRSLAIDVARLNAELAGNKNLRLPAGIESETPEVAEQARRLFDARRRRFRRQVNAQARAVEQHEREYQRIEARLASNRHITALVNEQIAISEKLLRRDITSRMVHIDLLREQAGLAGRLSEDDALLLKTRAALAESRERLAQVRLEYEEESRRKLEETRRLNEELAQQLKRIEDSLSRVVLRAPGDGIVKSLLVTNPGAVIKPGEVVVEIVPSGDALVIEAELDIRDIGHIRIGQTVVIRLMTSDADRYGPLTGEVVSISPDTLFSGDGLPYYKVVIKPDREAFGAGDITYNFHPGMRVETNIVIGERRIVDYFLDPIFSSFNAALREL